MYASWFIIPCRNPSKVSIKSLGELAGMEKHRTATCIMLTKMFFECVVCSKVWSVLLFLRQFFFRWFIQFLLWLLVDRENFAARQTHIDNLYRMVAFCENKTDCRRTLQLSYFGEHFDRLLCKSNPRSVCDNCDSEVPVLFVGYIVVGQFTNLIRFSCYRWIMFK